jgi:hypothetical protein
MSAKARKSDSHNADSIAMGVKARMKGGENQYHVKVDADGF